MRTRKRFLLATVAGGILALAALGLWQAWADTITPAEVAHWNTGRSAIFPRGRTSMEEQILYSDVIARVSLKNAAQTTELWNFHGIPNRFYTGVLEFTFDVREYLKGSGPTEVVAVVFDHYGDFQSAAEVDALGDYLLDTRDADWDDREAIVFLRRSSPVLPSTAQADRHWLGPAWWADGSDGYLVTSRWHRAWLPERASGGGSAAGAATAQEQTFLLDVLGDAPPAVQAEAKAEMAGRPGRAGNAGDYAITL